MSLPSESKEKERYLTPLLEVKEVYKLIPIGWGLRGVKYKFALKPISFNLYPGETLAFVGSAGSGRSTLARTLTGANERSGGQILFNGTELKTQNLKSRSRAIRMIFQDPANSLNPKLKLGEQLGEPLLFNTTMDQYQRREVVDKMLLKVGLLREHADFYPNMLAVGQRQRVAIARALILEPQIIIADEAFSGLDSSIRAQSLNLIMKLQKELGLAYIIMSHDLGLVRHISNRVIVLKKGEIVEQGDTKDVFQSPQHPYTKRLLDEQKFCSG